MKAGHIFRNVLGLLVIGGLLTGCPFSKQDSRVSSSEEKIILRLSDSQPEGFATVLADRKFAQEVAQKTKGRIVIQVYPSGQLGSEKDVLQQIQFGAIDACRIGAASLADFNKTIGVCALPYIFTSTDQMFRVLDGAIGDTLLKDLQANSRFVGLCWMDAGARSFYTTGKQVKVPEDLKGMKIRVQQSEAMIDLVKAFGASPSPIDSNDAYSALQSGVIDGAENNFPTFVALNHYMVCRYFIEDEHSRLPEMILFGTMSYDKLTANDQKILKDCAVDAGMYEREEWRKQELAAEKKATDAGVVVTKVTDKTPWQEKVRNMYSAHPEWFGLISQIQSVR